ncbi:MAG TPA: hypothetical protein VMH90_00740 [Thermoplasmata archaeon]|nr:hypothetical protein [Thermoplasmata archaeon]
MQPRRDPDPMMVEIAALRQEIAALREEQRLLADQVEEVARSFRAIATQIGIAAEPYKKGTAGSSHRDLPGFA